MPRKRSSKIRRKPVGGGTTIIADELERWQNEGGAPERNVVVEPLPRLALSWKTAAALLFGPTLVMLVIWSGVALYAHSHRDYDCFRWYAGEKATLATPVVYLRVCW